MLGRLRSLVILGFFVSGTCLAGNGFGSGQNSGPNQGQGQNNGSNQGQNNGSNQGQNNGSNQGQNNGSPSGPAGKHNRQPHVQCYNVNSGGSKIGHPDGENGGYCTDISLGGLRILPSGAGLIVPDTNTPMSAIMQVLGCKSDTGGIRVRPGAIESLKMLLALYLSGQPVDIRIGGDGGVCTFAYLDFRSDSLGPLQ